MPSRSSPASSATSTLAEDAVQDAFATALERWPRDGVPREPGAWIVTTARNRAIDRIRRERTFARKAELLARLEAAARRGGRDVSSIPDERLALVFTCCHPALARRRAGRADAARGRRAARRRRSPARSSSRSRRWRSGSSAPSGGSARRGSRSASRPTTCSPTGSPPCSRVLYLVFNEGYAATRGRRARPRASSAHEAIRLAKLLAVLMPDEPEALGLLALLLLHDSRREARRRRRTASSSCSTTRTARSGTRAGSTRACACSTRGRVAPAAGAVPAPGRDRGRARRRAPRRERDRRGVRRARASSSPSPVVELNRAVAVALAAGAEDGLALIDADRRASTATYLQRRARADLLRRLGRRDEAARGVPRGARAADERGRARASSSGAWREVGVRG